MEDLVKGDFTDALKGVSAVIHVATPGISEELKDILEVSHLFGYSRPLAYTSTSQITREGALNLVRQAVAAGVKHISFAGTVATVLDFTNPLVKAPLSDKAWNPLTEEFALGSGSPVLVYSVAKTQAEQALWRFSEANPELNLTTSAPQVNRLSSCDAPDRGFS